VCGHRQHVRDLERAVELLGEQERLGVLERELRVHGAALARELVGATHRLGRAGRVHRVAAVTPELEPRHRRHVGIVGLRRVDEQRLARGDVARQSQPVGERSPVRLRARIRGERRAQHFDRVIELPLAVVEVQRREHHVGTAG
jgi:hypothetical protein